MEKEKVKEKIIENADLMADILARKKKDVEIRKSPNGVSIAEISKKIVYK